MIVRRQLAAAAFALSALSLPLGASAQTATIKQGVLKGAVVEGVEEFWGIPYAAPPVGDLRWKPPMAAAPWTGERDATHAGASCQPTQKGEYTEDCLFANVTRPAGAKPGAKLPVYVWIHGGGFTIGSAVGAFGAQTDGIQFAKDGIITVSVSYRLGRAGWFAHPALCKEGPCGNYGYMDQIAALKWVNANIASFGGDPNNVTIGGESAGGISVLELMLAPDARGLFQKAIGESSFGRLEPTSMADAQAQGLKAAATAGVSGDDAAAAAALRKLPLSAMPYSGPFTSRAGPILDGRYVQGGIYEGFAAGKQAKVPLLIGGNSNEASLFRPQAAAVDAISADRKAAAVAAFDPTGAGNKAQMANDMATRQYITEPDRAISRAQAKAGQPVYTYYFSYVSPGAKAQLAFGAPHTAEIKYAFAGPKQQFADVDLPLAKSVSAYWAAFIKTGNPDSAGGPAWPKFAPAETYMEFSADGAKPHDHFLKAQLDWQEANVKAGGGASPTSPK
ncbi:carboxylesterase/lipase family protein [Phenylobacterium sp.]|jgi:para-nitrobenzyl esterase|uniref:carboxylesterase/lipase family protein n=1 Tax=Phenylobacterium sp. TaxID=1871053 RepID=UPI002E2EC232|nr:carboxylesterase family protein [Phenylobacterium sp.]HEX3367381.1 carboxylesterase family protein [Phenylobacterium sp.]